MRMARTKGAYGKHNKHTPEITYMWRDLKRKSLENKKVIKKWSGRT